jgi:hypothetical protein
LNTVRSNVGVSIAASIIEECLRVRRGRCAVPDRSSSVGVVVRAVVQPMTSTEHQTVGFETESKYRLRLVGYPGVLGAQSQVDWQGKRYAIDGDPRIYNGSRRTAHVDYVIVRR